MRREALKKRRETSPVNSGVTAGEGNAIESEALKLDFDFKIIFPDEDGSNGSQVSNIYM